MKQSTGAFSTFFKECEGLAKSAAVLSNVLRTRFGATSINWPPLVGVAVTTIRQYESGSVHRPKLLSAISCVRLAALTLILDSREVMGYHALYPY